MRANLALAILAMGALGMLLTFFSGEAYRFLTLETQRTTLTDSMRAGTNQLREQLDMRTQALAQYVQAQPGFARAIANRQTPLLVREMDNLYRHVFAVTGNVRITRLY